MEKNGQQPAFPHEDFEYDGGDQYKVIKNGLTKREYFAAMAMNGLLANSPDWSDEQRHLDFVSRVSVKYADALLTELNTKQDAFSNKP